MKWTQWREIMRACISVFSRNLLDYFFWTSEKKASWVSNHVGYETIKFTNYEVTAEMAYFWNAKMCNCFTICGSCEYNVSPRCCRTCNILWLKVMFYWEIIMLPVVPFTVLQIFQTDFQTKDIKHSINSACQCVKWLEEEGKKLHYNICTILQQHFLPWELHSRQV